MDNTKKTKYILVTGGVVSGLGKGTVTSSLGALLKACGFDVTCIKIDPYLNPDAGMLNPHEHGECFVLDDGGETDLDLGNYERALDINLTRDANITTGKINIKVLEDERKGLYGRTVQVIPHMTDAIQAWIDKVPSSSICLIELGGTIGDIEAMPFVEALRQFKQKKGKTNFCHIHVSLVPSVGSSRECKSKPTQKSASKVRKCGLKANIIILRSHETISLDCQEKVAFYAMVPPERIYVLPDLKSLYDVPINLKHQGVLEQLSHLLQIDCKLNSARFEPWIKLSNIAAIASETITIAIVGKYIRQQDSYHSVVKAWEHSCLSLSRKPVVRFVDSEKLEDNDEQSWQQLKTSDCLLVPGGFGVRGSEGKIRAIKFARESKVPYLGICFGLQLAVVEYARNVLGVKEASSAEFLTEPDYEPVNHTSYVIEMLDYKDPEGKLGGTMRLGKKRTNIVLDNSIIEPYYGSKFIYERHRHRYEVNPIYIQELEDAGLRFVGKSDDGTRMEIIELSKTTHPFFVGVQYHPEYLSRPFKPSPPFKALAEAALKLKSNHTL